MATGKTFTGKSRRAAASNELDDASLLALIGQSRDRIAFDALVQRYFKISYFLCCRLCGDAQMAEDATQDAMLLLWRRASAFDPKLGQARSWILRIVAQQALQFRRKNGRERAHRQVWKTGNEEASQRMQKPAAQFEKKELLTLLNGLLDELSERDRMLVALYYGAGLSQLEISHELKMPQRTVSHHLGKVMVHLRESLSRLGFAAVPGLERFLGDALRSGLDAPNVWGRQIEAWARSGPQGPSGNRTVSSKGVASQKVGAGTGVFLLLAVFALAGVLQSSLSNKAPDSEKVPNSATGIRPKNVLVSAPAPAPAPARSVPDPGNWQWSFQQSALEEQVFRYPKEGWVLHLSKHALGKRFLVYSFLDRGGWLIFPKAIPKTATRIDVEWKPAMKLKNLGLALRLLNDNEAVAQQECINGLTNIEVSKLWHTRFYIWSGRICSVIQGRVKTRSTYAQGSGPLYPTLFVRNALIHQVSMHRITEDQIPRQVREGSVGVSWKHVEFPATPHPADLQQRLAGR